MRARRSLGQEGMGWAGWLAAAVAGLLIAGAVGLSIYGGRVQPASRHYEQIVPDDRFPR